MKDEVYLEVFLAPIRVCAKYRPKFGNHRKANGYSFEEFRQLYGSDLFYSCLGLDSKFMYSAHKAAGGMTSIYRQSELVASDFFGQFWWTFVNMKTLLPRLGRILPRRALGTTKNFIWMVGYSPKPSGTKRFGRT